MFWKPFIFASTALLSSQGLTQEQRNPADRDPSELYGVRESIEDIDISPDGRRIVYLQPGPGRTTVAWVHDLASGGQPSIVVRSSGNPERLRWCNFITNERLICQISGINPTMGELIPFSRLLSLDTNGQNVTALGERASFYDARMRQFDGSIIDWLGGREPAVLMAREYVPEAGRAGTRVVRTADGLGVDRIDVNTLRTTQVEAANRRASRYITDGRGNVRIMTAPVSRAGGQQGTRNNYFYRVRGSREWRELGNYDTATREGIVPVAVDGDLDVAYVLRKLDGRFALYRMRLDGSLADELVYVNPRVDVDNVVWASRGSRVIGVTYAEEDRRVIYFDEDYAGLARSLGRAIPNLPAIGFGSDSTDGRHILVHAGSDTDAGRYYVFDRTERALNEILMVRPQLEHVPTAPMRAVSYPAADGVDIPAYLTLPPGSDGRNLPVVILPHGGPEARDEWGFDWLTQYLAHRGYAVLQANYRGSAGYGDQWLQQNGFRSWRTSIGDITAGARWLAAEGIGDPRRTAILGWSYGGYAALQAGVTDSSLFRAIVAIAPVTDLQQATDDFRDFTNARNVADYIGTGPHIAEGSPLRHVSSFTAPVLLFHGDRDLNVPVIHSRRMDNALRNAGMRSELTVFPGLEHDLADSSARVQMLRRIGDFLEAELR